MSHPCSMRKMMANSTIEDLAPDAQTKLATDENFAEVFQNNYKGST